MKAIIELIKGKNIPYTPIWFMRQAGRYLKSYRKMREKYTFLEMCGTPELSAEVTLQPVKELDVDAAIIFSDILLPLRAMGLKVYFTEKGPFVFGDEISSIDVGTMLFTSEIMYILKKELTDKTLIGFCGAPFTLMSYIIGKGKPDENHTKYLMYNQKEKFKNRLDIITDSMIEYLKLQVESGADMLQIFDTQAGILSPSDWKEFALPFVKKLIIPFKGKIPVAYYVNGMSGILNIVEETGTDILSIDWRVDIKDCRNSDKIIQGNLDPAVLLAEKDTITEKAVYIMKTMRQKRHIFNLGGGILPQTDENKAKFLVEMVHEWEKEP